MTELILDKEEVMRAIKSYLANTYQIWGGIESISLNQFDKVRISYSKAKAEAKAVGGRGK